MTKNKIHTYHNYHIFSVGIRMLFSSFLHDLISLIKLENCQSNAPNFSLMQFSFNKLNITLPVFLNTNA